MSRTAFLSEVESVAAMRGLDPNLLESLVVVESGGDPWAMRHEPAYRWLWDVRKGAPFRLLQPEELAAVPPSDFPALAGSPGQEWMAQRTSWGLTQLMGAVARELGFRERYLSQLSDPELNLEWGSLLLRKLLNRADGDVSVALAAYNAGWGGRASQAGLAYSSRVRAVMDAA